MEILETLITLERTYLECVETIKIKLNYDLPITKENKLKLREKFISQLKEIRSESSYLSLSQEISDLIEISSKINWENLTGLESISLRYIEIKRDHLTQAKSEMLSNFTYNEIIGLGKEIVFRKKPAVGLGDPNFWFK